MNAELYENLGKTGIKLQFKESREAVPSHPHRFEREGSPMKYQILTLLLITPLALSSLAAGQESSALSLKTQIALPSVKGRIDHLSVDVKGQRLFVAAVDNHTLEVIDLKAGHPLRTIADLGEPQGVFYDASSNRLFVACGLDGVTKVFDGTTFQVIATAKLPDDADNIRYDARRKRVIVGYAGAKQLRKRTEGAGGLAFLDSNGKQVGDVVIDAHPESFRLEETGNRIFVNVPDKKEIEVIDGTQLTVLVRWPVTSAQGNFPMALDEAHHRLFVGTWTPSRMLVLDTETGKEIASGEIAGPSDDLFYDSRRGRVYVLASAGFLEVFQDKDHNQYDRIAHYPTPPHTQTGLFVPEWGRLFAAAQRQGEQSAEIRVYDTN
jgi:DNA-binding beta-propeller fold protein YncE